MRLAPIAFHRLRADTGGTATLIRNGENGLLLPYDAPPEAFAEVILAGLVRRRPLPDNAPRRPRRLRDAAELALLGRQSRRGVAQDHP